jgi:TonB family protein
VLSFLILAPSFMVASAAVSAQVDPPTVRQSKNGEFMTKHYPYAALKRGEQGRVGFELGVDRDGMLTSCQVTQSSGHANLDKETCDFLIKYARLQPVQNADGRTVNATQQGFINWQLPKGAKQFASASGPTALDPGKKICRRYARTGSKVAHVRVCHTREEWAVQERVTRDEVNRSQELGKCDVSGGMGCR